MSAVSLQRGPTPERPLGLVSRETGPTGQPRIFVVGSYVHVFTIRVPHAPRDGETVIGDRSYAAPGGKGSNQAIQMARLGAAVDILAVVGDDALGSGARALWREEGLDVSLVRIDGELPTGLAFVILDEAGQNRIAVDVGANGALTVADIERAEQAISRARLLAAQFEPPVEAVAAALRMARAHGVKTLLNPAPPRPLPDDLLPLVDVLTPNRVEAATLTGMAPQQGPEALAQALRRGGVGAVVVTMEDEGAYVLDAGGGRRLPGIRVPVVDSTGAGDAFSGALAAGLARGWTLDEAVGLANRAGAHSVMSAGVVRGLGREENLTEQRR